MKSASEARSGRSVFRRTSLAKPAGPGWRARKILAAPPLARRAKTSYLPKARGGISSGGDIEKTAKSTRNAPPSLMNHRSPSPQPPPAGMRATPLRGGCTERKPSGRASFRGPDTEIPPAKPPSADGKCPSRRSAASASTTRARRPFLVRGLRRRSSGSSSRGTWPVPRSSPVRGRATSGLRPMRDHRRYAATVVDGSGGGGLI